MATETEAVKSAPLLSLGRKPVTNNGKDNALGTQVLNDSLTIIIACWVIIGLIWYSLRNSNI
jgi:hypothetical protein